MNINNDLRILIVEDELLIAYTMKQILADFNFNNVKIINDYTTALATIHKNDAELAILDINLGEGEEGLKLAKYCFLEEIPFFYVSSYTDQNTLDKALETAPGAYVIKPIVPTNLYSALHITLESVEKKNSDFFTFKDGTEHIMLDVNEITYLKADGIYVNIYTREKKYLFRGALSNVLSQLPKTIFLQTHRSFAVNNKYINKISSSKVFIDDVEIPISRTFKESLKDKLLNYN